MKSKILKAFISFMFLVIVFSVFTVGYIVNAANRISDSVLRLHIIAASDSAYDQNLKLAVRDRVLREFSAAFSECDSVEDSKKFAAENIEKIKNASLDELKSHGCYLPVNVELKRHSFPTKTYGDISLPCGSYTALDIKIGNADGQNWWCVMYPPLCISDNIVEIPASSKERLRQSLSADEYELIATDPNSDINIKFKLAEIFGKYFK